jgi:hypothetical protein
MPIEQITQSKTKTKSPKSKQISTCSETVGTRVRARNNQMVKVNKVLKPSYSPALTKFKLQLFSEFALLIRR